MKSKTKRLIALILGASLVFGSSAFVFADTDFLSSGRFEYKSDPSATEPDVILDSRDFSTIYSEVKDGKLTIAEKINSLTGEDTVSTDINSLPTFEELADALDTVHDKSYDEGVQQTLILLKDLTFNISIPVYKADGSHNGEGAGSLTVSYANGGTTWSPASSSRGIGSGGWAEGAPYCICWISHALVNINGVNDYTVTITVGTETGKIYGSSDTRASQTIVTRFKDGEIINSGGASYNWSSEEQGYYCGTPSWYNVNTYNP